MTHCAQESLTVNENALMSVKVIDIIVIHVMETAPKEDSQRNRKEKKKMEVMGQQIPQIIHFCVEDIETQEAQYQHSRDNNP